MIKALPSIVYACNFITVLVLKVSQLKIIFTFSDKHILTENVLQVNQ